MRKGKTIDSMGLGIERDILIVETILRDAKHALKYCHPHEYEDFQDYDTAMKGFEKDIISSNFQLDVFRESHPEYFV